jgi:hypothetical protein
MMLWGRVDNGQSSGEMLLLGQAVFNTGEGTDIKATKEEVTSCAAIVLNNQNYGIAKLKFKYDIVD